MRQSWAPVALGLLLLTGCADQPTVTARRTTGPTASRWPTAAPTTAGGVPTSPGPVTRGSIPSSRTTTAVSAWPQATRPTPPRDPTDTIKMTDMVIGIVTRGGSGPCYGVETDDGTEYALYSSRPLRLTRGQYVRLHTESSTLRIDCGSGQFRAITAIEPTP